MLSTSLFYCYLNKYIQCIYINRQIKLPISKKLLANGQISTQVG